MRDASSRTKAVRLRTVVRLQVMMAEGEEPYGLAQAYLCSPSLLLPIRPNPVRCGGQLTTSQLPQARHSSLSQRTPILSPASASISTALYSFPARGTVSCASLLPLLATLSSPTLTSPSAVLQPDMGHLHRPMPQDPRPRALRPSLERLLLAQREVPPEFDAGLDDEALELPHLTMCEDL